MKVGHGIKLNKIILVGILIAALVISSGCAEVCSGSGCLRYLVYLQAEDYVVGVDSMEKKVNEIEGRPYFLANPQLKDYPLIGEFRGKDDPEKLIEVNPQIILKSSTIGQASAQAAAEADTLQSKTGIPVISFPYGSLNNEEQKAEMYSSLRIMGEAVGKQERAEEVIAYIEATMQDLESRTADIPESERKTVYLHRTGLRAVPLGKCR